METNKLILDEWESSGEPPSTWPGRSETKIVIGSESDSDDVYDDWDYSDEIDEEPDNTGTASGRDERKQQG
jgi:hypothetical protein